MPTLPAGARSLGIVLGALALALAVAPPAPAATAPVSSTDDLVTMIGPDGAAQQVRRCGAPPRSARAPDAAFFESLGEGDCSSTSTNPTADYDPGTGFLIDVWVHVIYRTNGTGNIPDEEIQDQIAVLNEDYRAIPGSLGAPGNDVRIFFRLVGVTRTADNCHYQEDPYPQCGEPYYYDELAVDPAHYLNIYVNSASGYLGYVPFLPTDPGAPIGQPEDRVVVYWPSFGRDTGYTPYDLGRSATHEVGHYLGLEHTFTVEGSCGTESEPGCYSTGDLICDTEPQFDSTFGCPVGATSCSGARNPIENYMNYTDDLCMFRFTVEQNRRMRCALEFYRPALGTPVVFYDGFEGVGLAAWSDADPGS